MITSQGDTAPKHFADGFANRFCLITSQGDTAPKPTTIGAGKGISLITSQGDTAPKQVAERKSDPKCLITSQGDTAPKLGTGLYAMNATRIAEEAAAFDAELTGIIDSTPNIWDSKVAYRKYAKYVESKATKAAITIDDFTKIEGKELQTAQWFSNMDIEVHFRNHNKLENKSDVEMLGTLFDFKRVTSSRHQQVSTVVKKKLSTQGPGFVVDLSMSEIDLQDAMMECAHLLEKERIERLIIIKDGQAIELRK